MFDTIWFERKMPPKKNALATRREYKNVMTTGVRGRPSQ
jgi:hypothetical protein